MLFLAFSGSGRTREFFFGFLISIVGLAFFILFYSPVDLRFMSEPLHNQYTLLDNRLLGFLSPFGYAQQ